MKNTFTFLIIFLIHFFILAYSIMPNNNVDRAALLAFKSGIISDPHGVLNSWKDSSLTCEWQGVTCGTKHPQRVVALSLGSSALVGTLSPSVGNLTFLHALSLFNNSFGGPIPPQLGFLFRLRVLNLQENTFEGEIPVNLSHCLNLKKLGLGHNNLTGIIPSQLSFLSNLETLTLSKNRLTGDLLNLVLNMTSLQQLVAGYNSFQGSIPSNIGAQLQSLEILQLSDNMISGIIPPSFFNLSRLEKLDLSSNQLQGTLPFDFGFRLPHLTFFHIGDNSFHGNLPASLSNLTLIQGLSLFFNDFTGKLKFSAINMPNLSYFEVDHNYLGTGEADDLDFLQTLLNCSLLQSVEAGKNSFGSTLPDFLGNFSTQLTALDLSLNNIVGSIPSGLYNLISLERLALRNNYLTGQLSPNIAKLTKLQYLDLDQNYLNGSIPDSIGNLSFLGVLYLANNSFEGTIPSSLGECKQLIDLSLHQNNLSGPLPPLLFQPSSMLVALRLHHNHLQGIIPVEIEHLTFLVTLDLSSNSFSGDLPTSLSKCISLVSMYLGGNNLSGSIPQSYKSLTDMQYMYMSNNNLSGPIPDFLTNFSLKVLDLSFNDFEGEVPSKGVFTNLSRLIIEGNNKLCGGIPELHLPGCPPNSIPKGKSKEKGKLSVAVIVIIAVACLVVGVAITSSVYFLLFSNRKLNKPSQGSPLKETFSKVSYDMLLKATNRFSEANLLGAGRFGTVYKGVLDTESNNVVAVKVISLEQRGALKSFMAECQALRNIRHRNLLKILTICSSIDFQGNDFKALVYQFMSNGSLHQWIHTNQFLNLLQRVNIAIDVATAVDYLHSSCDVPIIHCDLKPSNILLDNDMVAHVGDFGLAKFHLQPSANNSSSAAVKGTMGYAAPEYGLGSMVSKEGDIYSYGIVLIEMMVAKSPTDMMFQDDLDIHKYARSGLFSDQLIKMIDPRILDAGAGAGASNENPQKILAETKRKINWVRSIIETGVKCSVESPQDRMKIEDAIGELQVTRDAILKELRSAGTMYI